jgi:2-polyprenyl-6-methoxyphenol hydroxylase-like FAD-dependent oxidoreductase
VGAAVPYRGSRNGRGFAYWYMDDPKEGTDWRNAVALWQVGRVSSMVMPMPAGRMVVMHMGPAEDVPRYRQDPGGMWERTLREHRHLAERVRGATRPTKTFTASVLPAFFRDSSGPGWALTGDAGHYKDPVIGQGIRDALEWSRRLGETAAPAIGDPDRLDRALRDWEAERDRAVLPTYHWANTQTRVDPDQPLVAEALRGLHSGHDFADIFSRLKRPDQVITPLRGTVWGIKALARPGADRGRVLRQWIEGGQVDGTARAERAIGRFRSSRPTASENPGWVWPEAGDRKRA